MFDNYKKIRNEVRICTRKLCADKQAHIARDCKYNPKKFWQYVNSVTSIKPTIPDIKVIEDRQIVTLSEDKDKADQFCDYFVKTFAVNNAIDNSYLISVSWEVMLDIFIKESMVYDKLSKLKLFKSPGPDNIPPKILWELRSVISKPISLLFNKSLFSSSLPDDWRKSIVCPVHKKG